MSDGNRNITDGDAAAIAAATAQQTPEGRREAGRRAINAQIVGQHAERRRMSNARFGRIFDKGVPEPEESPIDKALAKVEVDRKQALAEREAAEAERDLARAEREREEASAP